MSNGRPFRRQLTPTEDAVAQVLGSLEGAEIPGGCDHCSAFQTASPVEAGVWRVTVHHDDTCSWWVARQRGETTCPTD